MKPFLWFACGLLFGGSICWSFFRSSRLTLKKLERLLPESVRQESTTLPHRFKRVLLNQEAELIAAHEQLENIEEIFESLPVGFLQVDQNNQILSWNSKALELLRSIEAESLFYGDRLLLEMVRSYELDQLILEVREKGHLCQKEWVLQLVPGDCDSQSALVESSQSLRGLAFPLSQMQVAVILEDRSEIDDLKQDRDRWTSDVAHEFKTPLTAIRLVSETLEPKVSDDMKPWVQRLQSEVIRLNALVQDVLDLNYGQHSTDDAKLVNQFDLAEYIQRAWMNLELLAEQKDLSLYYDGPDLFEMSGDQSGIYRVLLNLLDNAVKHSPEQGLIWIRLRQHSLHLAAQLNIPVDPALVNVCPEEFYPQQSWLELDVMDMGDGIPVDVLPHVFKRFYRADESRVRSPSGITAVQESAQTGTGLGLAIAQEIVLAHNGQILAGNHPELKGAWFQLRIPV